MIAVCLVLQIYFTEIPENAALTNEAVVPNWLLVTAQVERGSFGTCRLQLKEIAVARTVCCSVLTVAVPSLLGI